MFKRINFNLKKYQYLAGILFLVGLLFSLMSRGECICQ